MRRAPAKSTTTCTPTLRRSSLPPTKSGLRGLGEAVATALDRVKEKGVISRRCQAPAARRQRQTAARHTIIFFDSCELSDPAATPESTADFLKLGARWARERGDDLTFLELSSVEAATRTMLGLGLSVNYTLASDPAAPTLLPPPPPPLANCSARK